MKSKAKRILAFVCAIAVSVSSIVVWNPTKQVEAAANFSPVYLPGFEHVTTSNFYDAAGVQMADSVTADADSAGIGGEIMASYPTLKNSEETVVETHDRTLLSLKLDFEEQASYTTYMRLEVAGAGAYKGFRIRPQSDTQLRVETTGGVQTSPTVYYLENNKVTSMADELCLQISFAYGDYDNDNSGTADDVKLGVYINGALCTAEIDGNTADGAITADNHLIFYNCDMTKLGTFMQLYTLNRTDYSGYNPGDITVSKVEAPVQEDTTDIVTLPGFTSVTTGNFFTAAGEQMAESVTVDADADVAGVGTTQFPYPTLKNREGEVLSSHDKTLLSVKMDLEKSNYTSSTRLEVAGAGDNQGFKVRTQDDDTLRLETIGGVQTSASIFMLVTDKVDSLAEEFNLQLSFEYGDFDNDNNGTADDVKVGIYINGALCTGYVEEPGAGAAFTDKHCIFYNCDMSKLGTYLKVYTEREVEDPSAGNLTISAIEGIEIPDAEQEPGPEQPTVVELPGFTSVTTGNFFTAAGEQMAESVTVDADADVAGVGTTQFPYPTLKNREGEVLTSHDKTLLSVKMDLEKSNYTSSTRLEVAGAGDNQGFKVRTQDDDTLRLETIGGVQTSASIFMLVTDKVDSLAEEFNLQLSFEYGDFDNDNNGTADDVKVGVYINGDLCTGYVEEPGAGAAFTDKHCIFYNCDMSKLGTYMKVYTEREVEDPSAGNLTISAIPGIEIPDAEQEPEQSTVVELPGFTSVTTGNFFTAAGEQMAESVTVDADADVAGVGTTQFPYSTLKNSEGEVLTSHDKTLLSVKMDLEKSNYTSSTRLEVAGAGDNQGFKVRTQDDDTLRLETIGGVQTSASIFMLQTDKVDSLAEEFNLQLSFEYGDFDNDNNGAADDVKVGVYINGALCTGNVEVAGAGAAFTDKHCIFYNCDMAKLGTYMKVYTERETEDPSAGNLTISAIPGIAIPEPEPEREPVKPNPNFKWITFDQFGITDKNYDFDMSGKVEGTLDKTVFDGNIKLPENFTGYIDMRIGGYDSEHGFRLAAYQAGHINLQWFGKSSNLLLAEGVTSTAVKVDPWMGRWMNLKISTEIIAADADGIANDIQLGIWFDDVMYLSKYIIIRDRAEELGGNLGIFPSYEGNSIGVKSNPDLVEVVQDEMKLVKPNEDFKWMTFSHFGIQDGKYRFDEKGNQGASGRTKYSLDKAVFSGDILLPKELSSKADIRIGGTNSWYGLMLVVEKSGNINFKWYDEDENTLLAESISPEKLGLEDWRGRWLNLKISTEIVAADKDGVANDMKVGLWFDDVPCATKYMIVRNQADQLGSYMGLLVWEDGMTVGVRSIPELIEAFDYEAFGLTKDWEKILLNTGLTSEVVVGKSKDPAPYNGDKNNVAIPIVMATVSAIGMLWYVLGGYNDRKKTS